MRPETKEAPATPANREVVAEQAFVKKHFVIFYSPGTFVAEQSEREVASWDVTKAVEMAKAIKERHSATPYGFQFITKGRGPNDLDSKVIKRSKMYYLGGKVETLEEVEARNNPKDSILISNMRCNGWKKIITNTNSWRWTRPLEDGDVVLAFDGTKPKATQAAAGMK